MTEDAKNLFSFIADHLHDSDLKGQDARAVIFELGELEEIEDAGRKIRRLLNELKQEGYIVFFKIEGEEVETKISQRGLEHYLGRRVENRRKPMGKSYVTQLARDKRQDGIHQNIMDKFIKKRYKNMEISSNIFRAYSKLFEPFVSVTNDDSEEQDVANLFDFIVEKFGETRNENYIKVTGPDGTGKSTFLSILYIYLYNRYLKGEIAVYPFYINLHYYDRNVYDVKNVEELNEVVKKEMLKDLEEFIGFTKIRADLDFLIIIDGNDKYDRTHLKAGVFLENALKEIEGHKKIICLGEKTNIHFYSDRKNDKCIDNVTTYTFGFLPVFINESDRWKDIIGKFCKIFRGPKRADEEIRSCIDKFNIKEIDYNTLTIFCDMSQKTNLCNIISISSLYHQYCLEYLNKDEQKLNVSVELAYRYFMTNEVIEQSYLASHWKEWELVHQHKTISNYLLAVYYSKVILEGKSEDVKRLQCVFTNGINIFLKSIINETRKKRKAAVSFCKMMFQEGDYRAQAQAAYLLGRIKDADLHDDVKNFLDKQHNDWSKKKDYDKKRFFFVKRSLLVSLLYLGDHTAGNKLLRDLFGSSLMNEVNRAFYLQYYDDVAQSDPETVILKDKGDNKATYTLSVLYNYVNMQLAKDRSWSQKELYEFQIHLFTLCSLIQARLHDEQWSTEKEKLRSVISRVMDNVTDKLDDNIKAYISMIREDIEGKSFGIGHLYDELYEVKDIQRRGWLEKIEKGSISVDRYENVIEHTYYAWLMGMLYLPETRPSGPEYAKYDKTKILNCLLIHDLAEKYVGDKLPEESYDADIELEKECMRRIFMHDMYPGIGSMEKYRETWKGFGLESEYINGRIAKEIDKIQAIYQYCTYKRQGARFPEEKEREWKKEKDLIKTSVGRNILEEVVLKKFNDIV